MTGPGETDLTVRRAKRSDAADFASHVVRHLSESGSAGAPEFAPVRSASRSDVLDAAELRWSRPAGEAGWGRAVLLVQPRPSEPFGPSPPRVVGHAELVGSAIPARLHRATLTIGVERAYVGRGHGRALADAVLELAREVPSLVYVDAHVFASNERAIALYASLGFAETARVPDAFRVRDGRPVADVLMTKVIGR